MHLCYQRADPSHRTPGPSAAEQAVMQVLAVAVVAARRTAPHANPCLNRYGVAVVATFGTRHVLACRQATLSNQAARSGLA